MPNVFLPSIKNKNSLKGQGSESDSFEQKLFSLATKHPEQKRADMIWHPILAKVARERAKDMSDRQYLAHETPDGTAANILVKRAGYKLPDWWFTPTKDVPNPEIMNYIESIAGGGGGHKEPWKVTWEDWMNSPGHKTHLLGLNSFYVDQIFVGFGHYYAPVWLGHLWVFLSCPPQK